MDVQWEVVAGADKGGILVRVGRDTRSPEYPTRLSFGATVRQIELHGDRLQYNRLSGTGPDIGWVSVRLKDKDLLKRKVPGTRAERASVRQTLQQQMQMIPHMKDQHQAHIAALDAADAEEDARLGVSRATPPAAALSRATQQAAAPAPRQTAPVAKAPQASGSKPKFCSECGNPLSATAKFCAECGTKVEQAAAPPAQGAQPLPSMDELMADLDDGDDEVMDAPVPAAPARTVPVKAAPPRPSDDEEVYEERIPSIDEILAQMDEDDVAEPPPLSEMLALLDKDAEEQAEYEDDLMAQQNFWNMGNTKKSGLVDRLMLEDDNKSKRGVENLAALQNDSAPKSGVFNFNDIMAFGELCIKNVEQRREQMAANGELPETAPVEKKPQPAPKKAAPVEKKVEPTKPADAPEEAPAAKQDAEDSAQPEDMSDAEFLASLGLAADGLAG